MVSSKNCTQTECILQVEDDESDVILQQFAFKTAGVGIPVTVVTDGQMAIDYLTKSATLAQTGSHPIPCLILLDLKLPLKTGFEVLEWIRQQPELKKLVVIVLTSSEDPLDVQKAYALGANCFVAKPFDHNGRVAMTEALKTWWLEHTLFPGMRAEQPYLAM